MQRFTDQTYLTQDQYKDSSNLDARIVIHQKFSENPQGWFNWVFDELLKLPADASVLELGCGTGEMSGLRNRRNVEAVRGANPCGLERHPD